MSICCQSRAAQSQSQSQSAYSGRNCPKVHVQSQIVDFFGQSQVLHAWLSLGLRSWYTSRSSQSSGPKGPCQVLKLEVQGQNVDFLSVRPNLILAISLAQTQSQSQCSGQNCLKVHVLSKHVDLCCQSQVLHALLFFSQKVKIWSKTRARRSTLPTH